MSNYDFSDGEYTIEVTMTGGTGRASIVSPTELTVKDNEATARIEWSSPNYDYMIVDGEKILNTSQVGDPSVFLIPVDTFDEDMTVIADTTAMSVPHEIEYNLNFDTSTMVSKSDAHGVGILPLAGGALGVVIVVTAVLIMSKIKERAK